VRIPLSSVKLPSSWETTTGTLGAPWRMAGTKKSKTTTADFGDFIGILYTVADSRVDFNARLHLFCIQTHLPLSW
jgi:hypothetical protein